MGGGHSFLEFPARREGKTPYFGNYPGRPNYDETDHVNAKTVSIAAYCSSKKVDAAIDAMEAIDWTYTNNCVHTAVEGMKVMGFPHAEKIRLGTIPTPLKFQQEVIRLQKRYPDDLILYSQKEMQGPQKPLPSLGRDVSPRLDFGGVSLSKTAELQLSIADIAGAAFDPSTGQLILFGPQNRYLPPVNPDDLAVAVKSVYGLGVHPGDPGISIDLDSPTQMKVRYDGATANTPFGQTIFEADYLLKSLVIGKNKATGQPFHLAVPGYFSLFNRLSAHQWKGGQLDFVRFWFIPEQITLVETEDRKGMVFSDVRMKVLSEAMLEGSSAEHPAAREFAEHFTAHYDEFARQFPVLEKLKNLGKITAIVKWLRENKIPFDTSFFANYQIKKAETPSYVSPIESVYQWTSQKTEKQRRRGYPDKVNVINYTHTLPISGGVVYKLTSENFSSSAGSTADELTSSALKSRPSENAFRWSFPSPVNRESFTAVAQSVCRIKKPGNVKKNYIDMSFAVPGSQALVLERSYNSFSEKESPFGLGWRITPYELELLAEKIGGTAQDGREFISYPMILVRTPEGEDFYRLSMIDQDNRPLFKSPMNSNFLQDNLNGTFTLIIPQTGFVDFNAQGRLLKIRDGEGFTIEYRFQDDRLVAICHDNGSAIVLEYDDNRLVKASGPSDSVVHYTYHNDTQLATVGNDYNTYLHYSYDSNKRLNKITDHLNHVIFEADYDDYNRAVLVKGGAVSFRSDFSLTKKSVEITDDQGNTAHSRV